MLATLIEYESDVLETFTTNALLIQIIARQDLRMPAREHDLDAARLKKKILARAKSFLAEASQLGFEPLTNAIDQVIEEYEGDGQ